MRSASILPIGLLGFLGLLAGCPAPQTAPAPTPQPGPADPPAQTDTISTLTNLTNQYCDCADVTCRTDVQAKVDAVATEGADPAQVASLSDRREGCETAAFEASMASMLTEMCACKDSACTETVNAKLQAWGEANKALEETPARRAAAEKFFTAYMECMKTAQDGTAGTGALPTMGQKCGAGDKCAAGLECVKYYGIAGPSGPEFTSCERRCDAKTKCGAGQKCVTIADGPGQVCRPSK